MAKNSNKKNKNDNKYNAENEIIIGVTTKPKEKVRVEKTKATRTNTKSNKKENDKLNNNKNSKSINNKNIQNKKKVQANNITVKNKFNKKVHKKEITKEEQIKKINAKKIIISIAILFVIASGGTIYYLTTPVFNIANIGVYGNERNSLETYISLSKINIGTTNIFAVNNIGISKNLKENAYVEEVKIERKLPNTIELHITERKVSYQIKYADRYVFLDNQGYILEISEEKKEVPTIEGFSTIKENINVGQRLLEEDLVKLNVVVKFINYCKYNTIENKITNIDVKDATNYIVYLKEDKKTVYLGDASNLSERLSLLKTILNNEKDKEIEIFMNGNLSEDEVFIRYVEKKKGD